MLKKENWFIKCFSFRNGSTDSNRSVYSETMFYMYNYCDLGLKLNLHWKLFFLSKESFKHLRRHRSKTRKKANQKKVATSFSVYSRSWIRRLHVFISPVYKLIHLNPHLTIFNMSKWTNKDPKCQIKVSCINDLEFKHDEIQC